MKFLCEKCCLRQLYNNMSVIRSAKHTADSFPSSSTRIIRRQQKNVLSDTVAQVKKAKVVTETKRGDTGIKVNRNTVLIKSTKKINKLQQETYNKLQTNSTDVGRSELAAEGFRCNDVNIQMLSENIFHQLFTENMLVRPKPDVIASSQKELRRHGIEFTKCPKLPEVNINLPKLQGDNILEHFYNIGEEQSAPYRRLVLSLIHGELPVVPTEWVMQPGWHQYSINEHPKPVLYPPDDALIFDVEVCMAAGTKPTLACAVSPTYWYSWVSKSLFDDIRQKPDISCMDINDLIPLESDLSVSGTNLSDDLKRPRIVVGHNVSYDRAKIKEQYWLEKTGLRFVDTMSMHVCISGVTSYQRAMLKSKEKEPQADNEQWMNISSLNSLSEVAKLYCGSKISKASRDLFTDGNMIEIRANFQEAMTYCSGDVIATGSILQKMFPMFLERFSHPVTFAGMLELGTAYLPINSSWLRYLENADATYDDLNLETRQLLSIKADKAMQLMHNDKYKEDLWMWDQDWSTNRLKLKKVINRSKKQEIEGKKVSNDSFNCDQHFATKSPTLSKPEEDRLIKINKNFIEHYAKNNRHILDNCEEEPNEVDSTHLQDLEETFKYLFEMKDLLPVKKPHLAGYPAWYRKLCSKPSNEEGNWTPGPHNISTSMQITPKLLSLCWEGFPLHYIRGEGWGFLVPFRNDKPEESVAADGPSVPLETLINKCPAYNFQPSAGERQSVNALSLLWKDVEKHLGKRDYYAKKKEDKTKGVYTGTGVWCNISIEDCCYFLRLPHKDGLSKKVGNPLAKDFLNKFSENVLTGGGEEAAKVLMFARMMSYWRNNRDRIRGQQFVWLPYSHLPEALRERDKSFGAILPQVVVCGTLTRRAMEPTWMTASNAHKERIGSELRGMVQAPPGYYIVGADVDSQELWIASLLGDAGCGMHGGTPLGWAVLAGSKAAGTDPHSLTARAINVSRDHAKVINYARIYGAGQNFAERLLKQFNPTMSDSEAKSKGQKMFTTTKGRRVYTMKEEYRHNFIQDGSIDGKCDEFKGYEAQQLAKLSGKTLEEMFNKPKWSNGTESAMFNKLEEIAGSTQPVTPFLGCRLSRALEGMGAQFTPTLVNWVVQSGAVDFLHLMLVNMRWLGGDKIRFCLSFHDEVRYLVSEDYKYEAALAMHITNLFTRAFCSQMVGLKDLPLSIAFFSSVEVDYSLRKDSNQNCETPSNPHGLERGYGVRTGESLDIWQTLSKCNADSEKLFDRPVHRNKV